MNLKVQRRIIIWTAACLISTITQAVQAQQLHYEGFVKGQKVGELVVIREVNDENVKINTTANIQFEAFGKTAFEFSSESMYVNQAIMQASSISKENGQISRQIEIVKLQKNYELQINSHSTTVNEGALFGTDVFYFEAPFSIGSAIELTTGEMASIRSESISVYNFQINETEVQAKYQEDKLVQFEMVLKGVLVVFKLDEN